MNRRTKYTIVILILVVAIFSSILLMIYLFRNNKSTPAMSLTGYQAEQELDEALKKLDTSTEKASVIKKIDTTERIVALTLDGMLNNRQMLKILELLEQYNVQATFFTEGVLAAEDDELINEIKKRGFGLGNYTLYANKHMEELPQEEMVADFVKSKNILDTITNDNNSLLKCNVTPYTDELLHVAKCSNIDYGIESTVYLSSTSFSSYEAAYGYVQKLKSGSIISVKLSEELASEEFEVAEPSTEDLDPSQKEENTATKSADIFTMLEYLIPALSDSGIKTVLVKDFPNYNDPNYNAKFLSLEQSIGNELADVYTNIPINQNWVGCSFKGIKNEKILDDVLEVLDKTKSHAAFFVTGSDILKYPDRIEKIKKAGHTIENGGNTGVSMTNQSFSDVYTEIESCNTLLKETFGLASNLYMPAYGKYDITMRKAAKAADYPIVIYNKNPIVNKEKSIDELLPYFEKGLKKGDIIYFDLDYHEKLPEILEAVIELGKENYMTMVSTTVLYQNKITLLPETPAAPSNAGNRQENDPSAEQARLIAEATENAIQKYLEELRMKNNGKLASQIKQLNIVQDAVAFLFYGISNETVFNDILIRLAAENATATFFVSDDEIRQYPDRIEALKNAGHELGIVVIPKENETYESVSLKLYHTYFLLRDEHNLNPHYLFQPWGEPSTAVMEAVSAMGFQLVGYDISLAKEGYLNESSGEQLVKNLFPESFISLHQGQFVYFRMNYYHNDNLLGQVMTELIHKKINPIAYAPSSPTLSAGGNYTGFKITSVGGLLRHKDMIYNYPLPKSSILPNVANQIYPGQLADGDLMPTIYKGYIGSVDATSSQELVGFSDEEIANIDSTGLIHPNDNVIFLTFDDWGSDVAVNRILHVLDKHNVKATFFVRTNYVYANPNLLRKIALAGHQIASHTNSHMTLANEGSGQGIHESLSKKQLTKLVDECVLSYEKMEEIIGDILIDGTPALQKWFRPPTLAVSKDAMEVVFDCGYNYIISGNFSTQDYEASDTTTLYKNFKNGILDTNGALIKGSILVMHFSDEAKNTPEALDLLLTENAKKSNQDPSKFRVGNMADYLTADYTQVALPTPTESLSLETEGLEADKISDIFSSFETSDDTASESTAPKDENNTDTSNGDSPDAEIKEGAYETKPQ